MKTKKLFSWKFFELKKMYFNQKYQNINKCTEVPFMLNI